MSALDDLAKLRDKALADAIANEQRAAVYSDAAAKARKEARELNIAMAAIEANRASAVRITAVNGIFTVGEPCAVATGGNAFWCKRCNNAGSCPALNEPGAPTPSVDDKCNRALRAKGERVIPRTCRVCGLGPCARIMESATCGDHGKKGCPACGFGERPCLDDH